MKEVIHKIVNPFPHLVVEEMYTENELFLIWEELNFLTKPHKFIENDQQTGKNLTSGKLKSESKSIILEDIYAEKCVSNILNVNKKLFFGGYFEIFSQINSQCMSILQQNRSITKIRYYEDNEEYLPHIDDYNYTCITFFHKFPKFFVGGELNFPDYNYEIPCNNNLMILFPSCIPHAANAVKMNNDQNCDGNGRYSMMQFLTIN